MNDDEKAMAAFNVIAELLTRENRLVVAYKSAELD